MDSYAWHGTVDSIGSSLLFSSTFSAYAYGFVSKARVISYSSEGNKADPD